MLRVVVVNCLTDSGRMGREGDSLESFIPSNFPDAQMKSYDFLPAGKQSLGEGGLKQRAEEILIDLIGEEELNQVSTI
jgi:hypothetical protein